MPGSLFRKIKGFFGLKDYINKKGTRFGFPFFVDPEKVCFDDLPVFVSHRNVLHIGCGVFGVAGEG